jgi:hypothetical protein
VRKLLASFLCLAAAVPAVAVAADAVGSDTAPAPKAGPEPPTLAQVARYKVAREHAAERRRTRAAEKRRRTRRRDAAQASSASPALQAIARCESGGDPHAIGGGGAYRGKYQFDQGTWASVGGSGDPAAAPEAEQDRRAAMLYSRSGASSWPVCGQ